MLESIKKRWNELPNWQRHAGGSAVLVMVFSAFTQLWGPIDWAMGAFFALAYGVFKEAFFDKNNTIPEAMKDIAWNVIGIAFVILVLIVLGNKI